jgi:adenosyl cobinamide kinase/adenosyl cobinamide phosphate guanylyltransferase
MIFVFGPLYSGKHTVARQLLRCSEDALASRAVFDVQELARQRDDLEALADELARFEAVVATEVGSGIVPLDAAERAARERAGRLSCLLAARADTVVRVLCGIPVVLKGDLP